MEGLINKLVDQELSLLESITKESELARDVVAKRKAEGKMFFILNWWDDEPKSKAQTVKRDDGSGEPMLFATHEEAEAYAKEQVNGHWEVLQEGKKDIKEEQAGELPKPDAKDTKSAKDAEKDKELDKTAAQGGKPSDDTVGATPKQEGELPKPDAAGTKSAKAASEAKLKEEVDGGENKGPDGTPAKDAPKTDTAKAAEKVEQDKLELQKEAKKKEDEKKGKKKVNEDDEEGDEGHAKVFLGKKGETFLYLVKEVDEGGALTDVKVLDAEDQEVYSAKAVDAEADLSDTKAIIAVAAKDVGLDVMSYDLFAEYFLPEILGKEEEAPKEEAPKEEAPKEEAPKEEAPIEDKKAVEGKVPDPKASAPEKIKDLVEQEDKIVEGLLKKYGLKG